MSRPSSGIKKYSNGNDQKSQNNLIIIQKDRKVNENSQKNLIIIENQHFKAQSNIEHEINKEKIEKRIKEIEKNVLNLNSNTTKNNLIKTEKNENIKLKTINPSETSDKKFQPSDKALISSETINENDEKRTKIISTIKIEKNKFDNSKNNNEEDNEINYYDNDDEEDEEEKNYIIFNALTKENQDDIIFQSCYICERAYPSYKLYSASCKRHFICRKCFKNYYEERIEEGDKKLICSVYKCNAPLDINLNILKFIISKSHYDLLIQNDKKNIKNNEKKVLNINHNFDNNDNENNNLDLINSNLLLKLQEKYKINPKNNTENLKLYTQRHVIDINSNENFFMYFKIKEQFCPICNEECLFSKTGTHFFKCLNCFHKFCKYCFKEFNDLHMDISNENHCKIYYRREEKNEDDNDNNNCLKIFLIEILMIIAGFYFLFSGGFLYIKKAIKWFFCSSKKNNVNCFLNIIIYFFTIIFFLISIPILLITFPYFPIFTSIFGF